MENQIGVIVDSFQLGLKEGIRKAREIGAAGIQIYAVEGEMSPENLTAGKRREILDYIKSYGLVVSALCGDLGGHGFQDAGENMLKIEKSKKILELARDLETKVVTTHIGIIPEDKSSRIFSDMQEACSKLCEVAKSIDGYFAIETGPEPAKRLKNFLQMLPNKRVCVNFDPANMVMVTGDDPVQGVYTLREYIVHTHVKDGIQNKHIDPRVVYGFLGFEGMQHDKISAMVSSGEYFREVPLGKGSVDFKAYFSALNDLGYKGFLTIEREVRDNPVKDISDAVIFVKQILNAL